MTKTPEINVIEVHALAGVFVPQAPKSRNPLVVIVTHSKSRERPDGCGALGHLNPHHAEHGVSEIFEGLKAHGINPDEYFGMSQKQLAEAVKAIGFEPDSNVRALRLLGEAKARGVPAVSANYGHEDGSVTIVGEYNMDKVDYGSPLEVYGAVCADARVPSKAVAATARCALERCKTRTFPELVSKTPQVQQPLAVIVYGKGTLVPDNAAGDVFKVVVDPEKGADVLAKVSLAYAIVNFGPQGKGPKSLMRITFHQAGAKATAEFKKHLSGAKGIRTA